MLCPCVHIAVSHLQYLGENYERADFSQKAFCLQVPCAKRNFGMFSFLQYMFATCFGFFVAKSMCFLVSVFETDWRSLICLVALSWWEHRLLSQLNVQLSFFLPNVVRRWCLGNLNGWKIYFPPERWSGNVVYCTISLLDFLNINTKLDFKTVDFGYARFWHHPVGTLDLSPPFPRSYSIPYLAPPKLLQCADWLAPSCFVFPALSTCNSTRVARDSSLCHSSARCETKPRLHCCCF